MQLVLLAATMLLCSSGHKSMGEAILAETDIADMVVAEEDLVLSHFSDTLSENEVPLGLLLIDTDYYIAYTYI